MTDDSLSPARRLTRANYDRLSRFYDLMAGWSEKPARDAALRALKPQPGESLLEVGAGTGLCLGALSGGVGAVGRVTGLDLSTGMLAVAAGKRTGARLVCDDATALPFRDGVLDGVVSTFTLELFPEAEIPRFLAECRRVLKPGGRLCVASLSARGPDTWVRRGYAWSHRVFPGVVDCRPIPVEEVVQGAGFADVSAAPVPLFGLQVDVVVGWVSGSLT